MKALVFSLLVTVLLGTLLQGLEPRGMYSSMAAQQQGQNVELVHHGVNPSVVSCC